MVLDYVLNTINQNMEVLVYLIWVREDIRWIKDYQCSYYWDVVIKD